MILLDKLKHLFYSIALRAVMRVGARGQFLFTQNLQSFANHFLDGPKVAGAKFLIDDFLLFFGEIYVHEDDSACAVAILSR